MLMYNYKSFLMYFIYIYHLYKLDNIDLDIDVSSIHISEKKEAIYLSYVQVFYYDDVLFLFFALRGLDPLSMSCCIVLLLRILIWEQS